MSPCRILVYRQSSLLFRRCFWLLFCSVLGVGAVLAAEPNERAVLESLIGGGAPPEVTVPVATPLVAPGWAGEGLPLTRILAERNLRAPLTDAEIVVTKSTRRLDLCSGGQVLKSYHVALGADPWGPKMRQGDGRTPEGRFFVCFRQSGAFHRFLGLSYPSVPDADRGLASRQISGREWTIIHQRLASRGAPPWGTRLGGWVGIHGGTGGAFATRRTRQRHSPDWTAGCIAVTDHEIDEIAAATTLGVPVVIKP